MPIQIKDLLICVNCKKPLLKVSNHEYKWQCGCVPNNWRLCVGDNLDKEKKSLWNIPW